MMFRLRNVHVSPSPPIATLYIAVKVLLPAVSPVTR
jgi:hypothetical protein